MSKEVPSGPSLLRLPPWNRKPLSLLIALYEANYQLCLTHLGPPAGWPSSFRPNGKASIPMIFNIMERSTYTSTFEIGFSPSLVQPIFVVRLYHDFKVGEVLAFAEGGKSWKMPAGSNLDLESRWSRNMAFQKWMHYAFEPAVDSSPCPPQGAPMIQLRTHD